MVISLETLGRTESIILFIGCCLALFPWGVDLHNAASCSGWWWGLSVEILCLLFPDFFICKSHPEEPSWRMLRQYCNINAHFKPGKCLNADLRRLNPLRYEDWILYVTLKADLNCLCLFDCSHDLKYKCLKVFLNGMPNNGSSKRNVQITAKQPSGS